MRAPWRFHHVAVLIAGLPLVGTQSTAAQIAWRTGLAAQSAQPRAQVIELLTNPALRGASTHLVVQFDAPVTPELREKLADAGVTLLSYLGNNGYFASVAATGAKGADWASFASLVDVQTIQRDWKLHPVLARGELPAWAIVPAPDGVEASDPPTTWIAAYVLFHRDVSVAEARTAAESSGARVRGQLATLNGMVVTLPVTAIPVLAEQDAVMYVEPALPALEAMNAENRALTGANTVQASPYNLSGAGVTAMVYDGGTVRDTHLDFLGRLTRVDSNDFGLHATHVAGTLGGDGAASGGFDRGMAPAVHILSYSFDFLQPQGITFVTDPLDLESNVADAMARGAEIMNASLGLNVAADSVLDCDLEGDYTLVSGIIDEIVRGALGAPFPSVWAAGNERSAGRCGTYGTISPPHAAKNAIVVGAVSADTDTMTSFSSWGPVDDGRIKPDVVAPGCQMFGDAGVTSTSVFDDAGYITMCGTSMAAPTVTGLAVLLLEDFKAHYPDESLPRGATLKALFAHTAMDRGNVGPDYQFGYGSIRITPAVDLLRGGVFWEDTLTQAATFTRQVTVVNGDPELKVTLAWDDYPATPNVIPSLINDLDLVVTSPTGVRHYPWTLNPADPTAPATRTEEDHLNNIEQVLVENPEIGTWTVAVVGTNVPEGPQPFTLVGDGANRAGIAMDFPAGVPASFPPGIPQDIVVKVLAAGESVAPGSPMLHYRYDGGVYQNQPLSGIGADLYTATLPMAGCGDVPEYYFSVEGSVSGLVQSPADAPTNVYSAEVGDLTVVFADDFETDQGWTASSGGATAGFWQRGVPVPRGALAFGPQFDADGSGQCYVTDNAPGLSDVDNGSVILTSPILDLSGYSAELSFAFYLYTNNYANGDDTVTAEASANGTAGPWYEIYRYHFPTTPASGTVWQWVYFTSDMIIAAGVVPSATTQIRFLVTDGGAASTVEGGIDALVASAFRCIDPTCADGILNQGEARIDCGGPCTPCTCTEDPTCDNGLFCDGTEWCDAYGLCQIGAPPCDAGEWCNATASSCVLHGAGDFDEDSDVDLRDGAAFQDCFGESAEATAACAPGNLTGADGTIDLADLAAFVEELDAAGPQ